MSMSGDGKIALPSTHYIMAQPFIPMYKNLGVYMNKHRNMCWTSTKNILGKLFLLLAFCPSSKVFKSRVLCSQPSCEEELAQVYPHCIIGELGFALERSLQNLTLFPHWHCVWVWVCILFTFIFMFLHVLHTRYFPASQPAPSEEFPNSVAMCTKTMWQCHSHIKLPCTHQQPPLERKHYQLTSCHV